MLELMLPLVSERLSLSALGLHTALLEPRYWRRSDVGGSNSLLRIYFAVAVIRISYTLSQRNHPRTTRYPLALTSLRQNASPIRPQSAPNKQPRGSRHSRTSPSPTGRERTPPTRLGPFTLLPHIREIAICRVAVINSAWFEWDHHAPLLREAGMNEEGMRVVGDAQASGSEGVLNRKQNAVLQYADAMTKSVKVPDETFQELKDNFSEKEVVEITATVAAYNCVSRFLVALDVGERNR
ncbi:hypothetical protein DTO027B5_1883 [Paecilomyces variotii]|nr:hypothetical protein DTO169C6_1021 [Paecilomyces variotii]KAJ9327495.1 hypothetical protein DTO027B3_1717 [Paecilomyces variotii]KAJ9336202.1 hypothetical protein DTO027B5_1883 [Paecilomyces variotii]KAJ9406388.1 hypothetical protein DTO045G8_5777 [Paecilomyces variotii]